MYKKKLANEIKSLRKSPVAGFEVYPNESNILEWSVTIYGPPDTLYEGGVFKAKMVFPKDYPFSPPKLQFKSQFWHPNVYTDGRVCISILHTPDPQNPEEADACWTPVQRVETILLSVISMLADPNLSSPANVDAGVELRKQPEVYMSKVLGCVESSRRQATSQELSKASDPHKAYTSSTTTSSAAAAAAASPSSSSSSTTTTSKSKARKRGNSRGGAPRV